MGMHVTWQLTKRLHRQRKREQFAVILGWAKNWVGAVPFFLGELVPIEHKVAWAEAYLHTKWHLGPSSPLPTTDIGRKIGRLCPFKEGELGPHLTQCRLD